MQRIVGQQPEESRRDDAAVAGASYDDEERRGRRARQRAAAGARSKAMKCLVGGIAQGSPAERARWTAEMIPRSETTAGPLTREEEHQAAQRCAWGEGNLRQARKEMRAAGKRPGTHEGIPWAKLGPLLMPGPSGDRQEHLDDMMKGCSASQRRRLTRALDDFTVRWAIGALPSTCRWLLNTLALLLRKHREPTSKEFDDEEWIQWLEQAVAESDVEEIVEEIEADDGDISMASAAAPDTEQPETPKVRPIQVGEWLRRWVSRRLLTLNKRDIGKVMVAMRQLGVGMSGGAESLAIFHQLLYEIWGEGGLDRPLARVKVDETNCFGRLEWSAVRNATREALPRHYPVACWKHAAASYVEQAGVPASPKDRGAEQGDVDGPLECSVTLGGVAGKARSEVHGAQRRGELPWASTDPNAVAAAASEYDERSVRREAWLASAPADRRASSGNKAIITDPRHEVQALGGIADFWYLDDGDILCDPRLVPALIQHYDPADAEVGGKRNIPKSEVLYYATAAELEEHEAEWQVDTVRTLASVRTANDSGMTLGVVTGSLAKIEEQLERKADVIRAMQERVAVTNDVQTQHVLNRECLGVGKVNHILRVHGDQLAQEGTSLAKFDVAMRTEMDRLFPGLTDEGRQQATLAAAKGGLGWRTATDTARPANLGALTMAKPKVEYMARMAVHAGLLRPGLVEGHIAAKIESAQSAYLEHLDETERVKAMEFLRKAAAAADAQWTGTLSGASESAGSAPMAEGAEGDTNNEDDADSDGSGRRLSAPHLQKELAKLQDSTRLRALEATLAAQGNWPQVNRLKDLRHPEQSHRWLWHLDSHRGTVLPQCDYIVDVQKRLGARIYDGDATCRICSAPLDPQLEHCECCATAEATRGHYAVVHQVVRGLRLADPAVTTEPRNLTSTQSRPADILTATAVPGRSVALDVCIASSNAAAAAGDAAEAAYKRKLRRYRREIPQLQAAGISFRPLVWTADGRPHPATTRTLHFAAELAANRSSQQTTARSLLSRWRHEIQVALQRRRAAMLRAVLPRASPGQAWLLTGHTEAAPCSEGRARPLDEGQAADAESDILRGQDVESSSAGDSESEPDTDTSDTDVDLPEPPAPEGRG